MRIHQERKSETTHHVQIRLRGVDAHKRLGSLTALKDSMAWVRAAQGAKEVHVLLAKPEDRVGSLAAKLCVRDRANGKFLRDYIAQAAWYVEVVDYPRYVRGGGAALVCKVGQSPEGLALSRYDDVIGVLDYESVVVEHATVNTVGTKALLFVSLSGGNDIEFQRG